MRTKNSIKNILSGIIVQLTIILLSFVSRKIFLDTLGTEYLGVNGLLSNVLSMLTLIETGISSSIIYNMYKPLAEKNKEKVIALVKIYKKIYIILAFIVFLIGIILYPLLSFFIKESDGIPNLLIVYIVFVAKNIIAYFNAHKFALINADQKSYVLAKYNLIFNIITTICKIIILKTTNSYLAFLIIEVILFTIQNIWCANVIDKYYPYIKTKSKYNVDNETKKNLITNSRALFLHNIGGYIVFGTDNMLISAFASVSIVGLYSNYNMIINQVNTLVMTILNGVSNSVGNLIATESTEKKFEIFKVLNFVNFWIYSISSIILYNLVEPFIQWWLGEGLLLDSMIFKIIIINFYISGMRNSVSIFKSKSGIFFEDRYAPLIESIINLVGSIVISRYIGIVGIFLGTMISTILIPFWIPPKLIYNKVFKKSVLSYFKIYIIYTIIAIGVGHVTTIFSNSIFIDMKLIEIIIRGLICVIIPNSIYLLLFYRNNEFKYLYKIIKLQVSNKYKVNDGINI